MDFISIISAFYLSSKIFILILYMLCSKIFMIHMDISLISSPLTLNSTILHLPIFTFVFIFLMPNLFLHSPMYLYNLFVSLLFLTLFLNFLNNYYILMVFSLYFLFLVFFLIILY